jgi:hypothetical protein
VRGKKGEKEALNGGFPAPHPPLPGFGWAGRVPLVPGVELSEERLLSTLRRHPGVRARTLVALTLGLSPQITYGPKAQLIEGCLGRALRILRSLRGRGKVRSEGKKWYPNFS